MAEQSQFEWVRIQGEQVIEQVKKLVEEGAVTRIVVKQDDRVVAEFPLALGAVAAAFAPVLAAVGAIVALLASCSIEAQRRTDSTPGGSSGGSSGGASSGGSAGSTPSLGGGTSSGGASGSTLTKPPSGTDIPGGGASDQDTGPVSGPGSR